MKVLFVYNSSDPQSLMGAALAKLMPNWIVTLYDIKGVSTSNITTALNAYTAIYNLIFINHTVTTAGTGVISPAQQLILDSKLVRTRAANGTASAASSVATLTSAGAGWTVNAYADMYVKTTGGTGSNQIRKILSNSSQVLTLESAWTTPISTDTTFDVYPSLDNYAYAISGTVGQLKRAHFCWIHAKFFPLTPVPLLVYKLAGDKTTADVATNAQNVLDESYITYAVKYFLRDLTDSAVLEKWNKVLFNREDIDITRIKRTNQDMVVYKELIEYGKNLVESATAFSVTL